MKIEMKSPAQREQEVVKGLADNRTVSAKVKIYFEDISSKGMKKLGGFMKKIFGVFLLAVLLLVAGTAQAQEPVQGLQVTTPFETGITGLWFPGDDTIAGGVNFTAVRVKYCDFDFPTICKIAVDLDGVIAKEVNADKETLYGPGVKVNYDIDMINDTGFTFKPSIGLTFLKNADNFDMQNVLQDWRFAIYGNVILYKF